jgi:hypothetical protein
MKQTLYSFVIGPLSATAPAVRLAADVPFTASTGVRHPAGNESAHYEEIALTQDGGGWVFPDHEGDTTDDSSDPNATYTAYVMSGSKVLFTLFERWAFSASFGAGVTFGQLEIFNTRRAPLRDDETYSKRQWDLLLRDTVAVGNPATVDDLGRVKVSRAPDDAASPYAAGANENFILLNPSAGLPESVALSDLGAGLFGYDGADPFTLARGSEGQVLTMAGGVEAWAAPSFTSAGSIVIGADTDESGSGVVSLQTRGVDRITVANDGLITFAEDNPGFVMAGGYSEFYGSQPVLHKLGHSASQRPPLIGHGTGTSGDVPVLVNHFFDSTSAPGGQFGFVAQLRSAGVEGSGATPPLYGNFKVAGNFSVENTPDIDTDAILVGQTIVVQLNPTLTPGSASRPIGYGWECDINNLHSEAAFGETDYPAHAVVGAQIINGGTYRAHRGLTLAAIGVNNQIRRSIVVEESAMFDCAVQLGAFTRLDTDGGACGVVARNYGGESVSFWVERLDDSGTAGGYAFKVSGHNGADLCHIQSDGAVIAPWFRATNGEGFYVHKDDGFGGSPSKGVAFSSAVPGGVTGDDAIISTYSSTGVSAGVWRNRFQVRNQADEIVIGGSFGIAWGVGSPEGVKSATPGWLYVDTGGALYVKQSGAGATGWVLK